MPTTNRILSQARMSDKAKKAKAQNPPTENIPVYEPDIPDPRSRDDLIKHWIDLCLDDRTANKMLWITEGGAKVARMTDDVTCPVLDRPERFEYAPQVLCKEGIQGFRGYWEVEYSGWVVVGVAYEQAGRRNCQGPCGFGENEQSWGFGWSGSSYHAWHEGQNAEIKGIPKSSVIGVYLDEPAGLMRFYAVEEIKDEEEGVCRKEVKLVHQFKSSFTQKMLPGFWVGTQSHCSILKKEE
ncbi:stonustoxin subunit beta [Nothobranchius furzeri]|uniref:Stonustoxin subunit beta-like n=2 Tax=Nothobranchius TaxID=28779 RepID=A0A1A8V0P4_NOTFU|nr:stonustoxin subunit beta [Nothobranchius furzeri]KAF7204549.1 stonustoxin subunit beta-like [Nothobranchius furzeri]